ncbi:MAG: tetratricopeptide repeat protein [Paracoccaceae bacterium]
MRLALAIVLSLAFSPAAAQDEEINPFDALDTPPVEEINPFDALDTPPVEGLNLTPMQQFEAEMQQFEADVDEFFRQATAQYNLALQYETGRGVLQNYAEAIKWYRLAAEQGDPAAQFALALMYEKGLGVQSNVLAHIWYNIASANGLKNAGERRDERAKNMTSAEVVEAQTMARECMNSGYTKCGY